MKSIRTHSDDDEGDEMSLGAADCAQSVCDDLRGLGGDAEAFRRYCSNRSELLSFDNAQEAIEHFEKVRDVFRRWGEIRARLHAKGISSTVASYDLRG